MMNFLIVHLKVNSNFLTFEVKYCAVSSPRSSGKGVVHYDMNSAKALLKKVEGSRLKIFHDYSEALDYASRPIEDHYPISITQSPKVDIELCPFRSVTRSTFTRFRIAINKDNTAEMRSLIAENPLILVTTSDTPTLLQLKMRFNSLHVAASSGSWQAMHLVLEYLNSPEFWSRIYPKSTTQSNQARREHVTDLYLNSPELGNLETPLHFACKYGHLKCIRLLVSHPRSQLDAVNKHGQTPKQVALSRYTSSTNDASPASRPSLAVQIDRILTSYYVVLVDRINVANASSSSNVEGESIPSILPPLTVSQLQSMLASLEQPIKTHLPASRTRRLTARSPRFNLNQLGLSTGVVKGVRALAGPMLRQEAENFHKSWLYFNNRSKCRSLFSLRMSDTSKGYERQGRLLSRLAKTEWLEYWSFLGDFVDLQTTSGLQALEDYLATSQSHHQPTSCNNQVSSSSNLHPSTVSSKTSLCTEFDQLASSDQPSTPISRRRRKLDSQSGPEWTVYRNPSTVNRMLNDSLNGSSSDDSPDKMLPDLSDHSTIPQPLDQSTSSSFLSIRLSPVLALLKRLTFAASPRWLIGGNGGEDVQSNTNGPITTEQPIAARNVRRCPPVGGISLSSSSSGGGKRKLPKADSSMHHALPPRLQVDIRRSLHQPSGCGDKDLETAVRQVIEKSTDNLLLPDWPLKEATRLTDSSPLSKLDAYPHVLAWLTNGQVELANGKG